VLSVFDFIFAQFSFCFVTAGEFQGESDQWLAAAPASHFFCARLEMIDS
jgi:hypothetical protein